MKVGLIPVNIGVTDINAMTGLAQRAEQLGYESVWTFEHVIVPMDYDSKYPYSRSGKMAAEPETPFVDPLIALTAIATATQSIRLGTGVNILSQANPLFIAKQAREPGRVVERTAHARRWHRLARRGIHRHGGTV